jgi:hypothetical protein
MGLLILGRSSPRISEVGHQNGNAEPIVIPAVLPHEGDVGPAQGEYANQLSRVMQTRGVTHGTFKAPLIQFVAIETDAKSAGHSDDVHANSTLI